MKKSTAKNLIYIVCVVNFIFGAVLLAASFAQSFKVLPVKIFEKQLVEQRYFDIYEYIVVIGIFNSLVVMMGTSAIRNEHTNLFISYICFKICLLCFGALLMLLLIVVIHLPHREIGNNEGWQNNQTIVEAMNQIQDRFECCGLKSSSEYGVDFPVSCCPRKFQNCDQSNIYKTPCSSSLKINLKFDNIKLLIPLLTLILTQCIAFNLSLIFVQNFEF